MRKTLTQTVKCFSGVQRRKGPCLFQRSCCCNMKFELCIMKAMGNQWRTSLKRLTWWELLFQFNSVAQFNSDSVTPWTAACQASLSITNSRSLLRLMSIESVMSSNHLILCCPFSSCLQSCPALGSFQMSQFFTSGGQSIGVSASASVLLMNIQDWFPLGWTGWISLQSKGLSNTTVQSIISSALSFLYSPSLTSVHDYWKNHSFD